MKRFLVKICTGDKTVTHVIKAASRDDVEGRLSRAYPHGYVQIYTRYLKGNSHG